MTYARFRKEGPLRPSRLALAPTGIALVLSVDPAIALHETRDA